MCVPMQLYLCTVSSSLADTQLQYIRDICEYMRCKTLTSPNRMTGKETGQTNTQIKNTVNNTMTTGGLFSACNIARIKCMHMLICGLCNRSLANRLICCWLYNSRLLDRKPMSWLGPLHSHKPPEWNLSFGRHLLLLSAASSSPLPLLPSLPLHLNLHCAKSTETIYHQILLQDDISGLRASVLQ